MEKEISLRHFWLEGIKNLINYKEHQKIMYGIKNAEIIVYYSSLGILALFGSDGSGCIPWFLA